MYKLKYISFDIRGWKESIASVPNLCCLKVSSGVLGAKQTIHSSFSKESHAQGTNMAYPNLFKRFLAR
jgi:hypothetical protein